MNGLCLAQTIDITLMDSLKKKVFLLAKEGNYEEMFKINFEYLKCAEKNKDTNRICEIYNRNKITYQQTLDYSNFVQAVDKSELFCQRCTDTVQKAVWLNSKAFQYFLRNNYDSSIAIYHRASQMFLKSHKKIFALEALAHLDVVYEKMNQAQLATQHIHNFYNQTVLEKNRNFQLKALHKLASHYNLLQDGEKALRYSIMACDIAWERKDKWHISNALENEAKAQFLLKNYSTAQSLYHDYIKFYKDSVISEERIKAIENLAARYENSKKETTIELQKSYIVNQKRILLGALFMLIVALIASFAYYLIAKKLKKNNEQKEFLIKEIHHRVKNNLQLLSSLLHLQSKHVKDPIALQVLRESQSRAEAMGIIHQRLYIGSNINTMNMNEYLNLLSSSLLDTFDMSDRIKINNYSDYITLEIDSAIQIGLILNELITNSLKYAFPNQRIGQIDIIFQRKSDNSLYLGVHDSGIGISESEKVNPVNNFGNTLISLLVKKLNGTIAINSHNGYKTDIIFTGINFQITKQQVVS